jgi:hypothetical protein
MAAPQRPHGPGRRKSVTRPSDGANEEGAPSTTRGSRWRSQQHHHSRNRQRSRQQQARPHRRPKRLAPRAPCPPRHDRWDSTPLSNTDIRVVADVAPGSERSSWIFSGRHGAPALCRRPQPSAGES